MYREPSLHITEKDLIKLLEEVIEVPKGSPIKPNYTSLAKDLCIYGRKYQITKRKILATNEKDRKRTRTLVKSSSEDAYLFCQLLVTIRKRLKHRGINIIKEGSREWVSIKETTKLAVDFCNDFNLDKRTGFTQYIEIALSKMNKFSLNRFNSFHQSICEHYESVHQTIKDPTPKLTSQVHLYYQKVVNEKVGFSEDFSKTPDKYIYFIQVVSECKKLKVDYKTYIDAQFEGLAWCNGIPEPPQLVGDKARGRLRSYLSKNQIKAKQPTTRIIDFSTIRNKK